MRKFFIFIASTFLVLLSLAFMAAVGIGCFFVFRASWNLLITFENDFVLTVGGLCLIAAALIISFALKSYNQKKRLIEVGLYDKKAPVYDELTDFIIELADFVKQNQTINPEAVNKTIFTDLSRKLVTRGSDEVVGLWARYQQVFFQAAGGDKPSRISDKLLDITEDLLLAIRKDLGFKNFGIPGTTVLGMFTDEGGKD